MPTRSGSPSGSRSWTCSSWSDTSSPGSRNPARVARPSGGKSEYFIGRKKGLLASVRAGRSSFALTAASPRSRAATPRARAGRRARRAARAATARAAGGRRRRSGSRPSAGGGPWRGRGRWGARPGAGRAGGAARRGRSPPRAARAAREGRAGPAGGGSFSLTQIPVVVWRVCTLTQPASSAAASRKASTRAVRSTTPTGLARRTPPGRPPRPEVDLEGARRVRPRPPLARSGAVPVPPWRPPPARGRAGPFPTSSAETGRET